MPDYIVLRLIPSDPIEAATFTTYLTKLTIKAYDISFDNPDDGIAPPIFNITNASEHQHTVTLAGHFTGINKGDPLLVEGVSVHAYNGIHICKHATATSVTYHLPLAGLAPGTGGTVQPHVIGVAHYNTPALVPPGSPFPPPPPPYYHYPAGTSIVQHTDPSNGYDTVSVATAIIEVPAGIPEYVSPSILVEFDRSGLGPLLYGQAFYEVHLYSGPAPHHHDYQYIPRSDVSAYLTLPAPLDPALLQPSSDGIPPNYDALMAAIKTVLKKDPGGTPTIGEIDSLSADQCHNLAYQILWGPQPPMPNLPDALHSMYTDPPNTGTNSNANEQSRQEFEGDLGKYYAQRNAEATKLAGYVFAASCAVWCEQQSHKATSALLTFPVNPTVMGTLTTINEAQVMLTGALHINVPAEYFYALGAQLTTQCTPAQRYQLACGAGQDQNLALLKSAFDAGVITVPAVNPAQAVRIMSTLLVPATSTLPQCPIHKVHGLWQAWRHYTPAAGWEAYASSDDTTDFWPNEVSKSAPIPREFLELVLFAITEAFKESGTTHYLADEIRTHFSLHNVSGLNNLSASDWQGFFAPGGAINPNLLPPFTQPGTDQTRVNAFIRHVQQFFDMPSPALPGAGPGAGNVPTLDLPTSDLIGQCVASYNASNLPPLFTFPGGNYVAANLAGPSGLPAIAATLLSGDAVAQAWLVQAVESLNQLAFCSNVGVSGAVQFSLMEALYARGFTSIESILDLPLANFTQALAGTVAWAYAADIYSNALSAGTAPSFPSPSPGNFVPINDGSLINCIPPCFLSPLSPVAYLHEMLKVSQASTCEDPFAPPLPGHSILGTVMTTRRGPIGSLQVTCANLETPVPLIDIVNECLEFMASTSPPTQHGTIYNTAEHKLAGHKLCEGECCCCCEDKQHEEPHCHKPGTLFAALPEASTPATPVAANSSVEPGVFDTLKENFSDCCLPYSQALDVSRTYLRHFRSCRYEEMRVFRKCITEFVLDPLHEPTQFQSYLWRYPVRIDIAIEYLGITPEEYLMLFTGMWPRQCHALKRDEFPPAQLEPLPAWQLYGFASATVDGVSWISIAIQLPEFLKRTCLSYCEFLELRKSRFVHFRNGGDEKNNLFPPCEPCCLEKLCLDFPDAPDPEEALAKLAVFIRLWHKLKCLCGAAYSFTQLRDICEVLGLYTAGTLNPDFVRQLAAFQMLRDQFRLELVDPKDHAPANSTGAERTQLLALWATPTAPKWHWAVGQLISGIERHALCRYKCQRREPELLKLLAANLDPLSRLAGFDPADSSYTWHRLPTHTLRFAEILAKIYASNFSVGEILYLFTADSHLDGDDPFPLQEENEALDAPLSLPDEEHEHSLWKLRHKLLETQVSDEEARQWTWKRAEAVLHEEFGFEKNHLRLFAQHFFPQTLESEGQPVNANDRRYSSTLLPANTHPHMWNTPPEAPFHYDPHTNSLWATLPLRDEEVIEQLTHLGHLKMHEREAVQDLYFQPRASLAAFAFLFTNLTEAEQKLIEEREERERWAFFQRQFALCHSRCHRIAEHLTAHVASATGQECPEGAQVALLLLRGLFADENRALTNWEHDSGAVPPVTWTPRPNGGAFAALLGLTGTGLLREFSPTGGGIVWRDVCGSLSSFGRERDSKNCPVPTMVPAMNLALTPEQQQFVSVLNGFAMKDANDTWLGGAQGFTVKWTGALLIEEEGSYEFCAGDPTPENEKPHLEAAERRKWRVILKRGQRTWILLNHQWADTAGEVARLPLKRGAYEFIIEFVQPAPEFQSEDQIYKQRTGFQIKYSGPDSHNNLVEIPHCCLFRTHKDEPLGAGITGLEGSASAFLSQHYTSSLRDIRRTYQRAFKSLLFAHRFALSAKRMEDGHSELEYLLGHKEKFAGISYYMQAGGFVQHAADFDFNFLPVADNYFSPPAVVDSRVEPSLKRKQAMFDWWERMLDYDRVRKGARESCDRHLWLLFDEAAEKKPAHPGFLLRHMCVDARHWRIDLRYCQDPAIPYEVTSEDLEDERWVVRAWHADRWICELLRFFRAKDITQARPDLWASLDPSAPIAGETGNGNLSKFLLDGCLESGAPRLYEDVKRLNDGLREHGRCALIKYLCGANGIVKQPKELSRLLLLDVETGICERASRIDEAISAVQTFVQRARLGLEHDWSVTHAFARLWDSRFVTFRVWEACKRRELYKENWVDWHDLEKAKKIEAFQFLDEELRRVTLTVAVPGGVDWWPKERPPTQEAPCLLQRRDPATMTLLPAPREEFGLLATPERAGRPSWLAMVPDQTQQTPGAPGVPIAAPMLSGHAPGASATPANLPFWMQAALKLGRQFIRVAAAGYPAASTPFRPDHRAHDHGKQEERCVDCCRECGCHHPFHVDEYYFWLEDARIFEPNPDNNKSAFTGDYDGEQNSYYDQNEQTATPWHDTSDLPGLLKWSSNPIVRLAWCRVHNGEFQQPRKSDFGVSVPQPLSGGNAGGVDLTFLGRAGDSLFFQVANATITPDGYRYDLAVDEAVESLNLTVPGVFTITGASEVGTTVTLGGTFAGVSIGDVLVVAGVGAAGYNGIFVCTGTAASTLNYTAMVSPLPAVGTGGTVTVQSQPQYPGGLFGYPFFVYAEPGARLFPWTLHMPAIAVAAALRAHCRYEAALKWYQSAFDPFHHDNIWVRCLQEAANPVPDSNVPVGVAPEISAANAERRGGHMTTCCDSTKVPCRIARNRSILLHYIETLLEWSDSLMRRNAPEAFQQARLLLDTAAKLLGKHPRSVVNTPPLVPYNVSDFKPEHPPLNPRLLMIYDRVDDRLGLIHHCLNAKRLRNSEVGCCMPYWEKNEADSCGCEAEWCCPPSPYRFLFLVQKAQELAGQTRELGSALLAAFEKGDGEYLGAMKARQERELLVLTRKVREDQWRDADWQVQALGQTKESSQTSRRYYAQLIQNGLNNDESQYVALTQGSMNTRGSSIPIEAIGEAMNLIPDLFVGEIEDTWLPIGTKLAGMFQTLARITNTMAEIQNINAGLDLTEGGWDRRQAEWVHQVQVLDIEIEQIELQILGAERRRSQALRELNNNERQIEDATEVANFLRDKFTSHATYLWLQKETAALYCKMYELTLCAARQAERAFNFERCLRKTFVPCEAWDNFHEGLMAGERLQLSLSQMEKEYLDLNVREYELTKHISLKLHFPMEFLRLKVTGRCEIEIPEWMFDLDYPGQYMRRIKNVSLTIPCVTGPYTGVHCRLTLLCSQTRIDPMLTVPPTHCCDERKPRNDVPEHHCCCCEEEAATGYDACCGDPRIVKHYAAKEAIATSSGQNDAGLFELNFRDERYLPFEFNGAVSRWRIELPPKNNYFDMDTLSDVVMHLNYTAREGGEMLRHAASGIAQKRLPGSGWSLFDIRYELPDAWELFLTAGRNQNQPRELSLRLNRRMFPFIPCHPELWIDKMALLFETSKQPENDCPECACPEHKMPACHKIKFTFPEQDGNEGRGREKQIVNCVASEDWRELYYGLFDVRLGPFGGACGNRELRFQFPAETGQLSRVYLFCHYRVDLKDGKHGKRP